MSADPPLASGAATPKRSSRLAFNTAIFSIATGASRVVGLLREIVAARYFGTSAAMSAFTVAFNFPNLIRALVADAALSAAFVPVFTELLDKGKKREAYQLAAALFGLILAVLGAITAFFIVLSPYVMPLFTGSKFGPAEDSLTSSLAQVLFPTVLILGLNGLVVGILNAHNHFSIPAIAPLVWNVVIIGVLVATVGLFHGNDQIYAYAIAVLAGTAVQFLMVLPVLKKVGFPLKISFNFRHPELRQVLILMLPITIGLGIINFDLMINAIFGTAVSDQASSAIERAFRIYMLPQGMFSVAVATVLFPTLSRLATGEDKEQLRRVLGNGLRLISLFLIPAAAATIAMPDEIVRLIYERGKFTPHSTEITSQALFWFSFSLPLGGFNLLLTRTFFSLRLPWRPTVIAAASLVVNVIVCFALYKPLGIAGLVIGTVAANLGMTIGLIYLLRRELGGLDLAKTARTCALLTIAAAALGASAYGSWALLDPLFGRTLFGQIASVIPALLIGSAAYVALVRIFGIEEFNQLLTLVTSRLRRGAK